jgi:hypothetical protein
MSSPGRARRSEWNWWENNATQIANTKSTVSTVPFVFAACVPRCLFFAHNRSPKARLGQCQLARFSELAVFDTRLYIRVRGIDEHA